VVAEFDDGTTATGTMLIGCDGSRSQARKVLCPNNYSNYQLPIRLMGATVSYDVEKCKPIQDLDPYFFQCCDPQTDNFMFYGFLDVPSAERQSAEGPLPVTCQVLTSWPCRPGFLGIPEPVEIPEARTDRVAWMKRMTTGWTEPFRSIVQDMPEDTEPKVISLEDWVPVVGAWDNHGRVTLIGDAAHAMTMCKFHALSFLASPCHMMK
jgi:2-polyprenyl-6-methoxyphenol hydroxylase-like FAD-dependent oxidoreductase